MAPLNVRSALHVKTVIWYFRVRAWRSSSKWEFEERDQLTPFRMWWDLNDWPYIRMHSWWKDSSFHTEMKSPALPRAERENCNALGCSTKLPVLGRIQMEAALASSFGKKEPGLVWNCLKEPSAGTLNTPMLAAERARGWGCSDPADIRRNMSGVASPESIKHTVATKASRCRQ